MNLIPSDEIPSLLLNTINIITTRTTFSRVYTSAKAANVAKLLL